MIRINLAPEEELKNPHPWLLDVFTLLLALVVGSALCAFFLNQQRAELSLTGESMERLEAGEESLSQSESLWRQITAKDQQLAEREEALRSITESKLARYRPVLLMEHIQALKPEGVWLSEVGMLKRAPQVEPNARSRRSGQRNQNAANQAPAWSEITISGHALDNVFIADFISALKSTQTQEVDPGDLRTQIYFDVVSLTKSVADDSDYGDEFIFNLKLNFRERVTEKDDKIVSDAVWPGGLDVLKF